MATLKLKVSQTLRDLSPSATAGAAPAGEFEASLKLKVTDNQVQAKLKIEFEGTFDGGGAAFGPALQGFVQTLFSAMQSLFGLQSPGTGQPTPRPLDGGDVPVVPAVPAVPVAPDTVRAALPVVAANDAPAGSAPRSLSVQLRMSYGGFTAGMAGLAGQLADPAIGQSLPDVAPVMDDLKLSFDQLRQASGAASGFAGSLSAFLTALSGRLAAPTSGGDAAAPVPEPLPMPKYGQLAFSLQTFSNRPLLLAQA